MYNVYDSVMFSLKPARTVLHTFYIKGYNLTSLEYNLSNE